MLSSAKLYSVDSCVLFGEFCSLLSCPLWIDLLLYSVLLISSSVLPFCFCHVLFCFILYFPSWVCLLLSFSVIVCFVYFFLCPLPALSFSSVCPLLSSSWSYSVFHLLCSFLYSPNFFCSISTSFVVFDLLLSSSFLSFVFSLIYLFCPPLSLCSFFFVFFIYMSFFVPSPSVHLYFLS